MAPYDAIERPLNCSDEHQTDSVADDLISELESRLPIEHFKGVRLLLAVSGGADSVAMLHLLTAIWIRCPQLKPEHLAVAHFNHGLRGAESDGDERFVMRLSKSLSLECYSKRASLESKQRDEASLRSLRYRYLQQTAERLGARYVLVAHHRDDNIETFLHHLFRGSGLQGLTGMRRHRPLGSDVVLYRPLLEVPQSRLRAWLSQRSLGWREDASNQSTNYQRNWIRHSMMPQILERYASASDSIQRTIDQQLAILHSLQPLADRWIEDHVRFEPQAIIMDRSPLDLSLLGLVISQLWDRQGWSRQSLTQAHLHQLWQRLQLEPESKPVDIAAFHLPGQLHVTSVGINGLRISAATERSRNQSDFSH